MDLGVDVAKCGDLTNVGGEKGVRQAAHKPGAFTIPDKMLPLGTTSKLTWSVAEARVMPMPFT